MVQAPREPDEGDMSGEEPADDTADDAAELDRFRDLARKLVQVPKDEIDAERAREDERRDRQSLPVSLA